LDVRAFSNGLVYTDAKDSVEPTTPKDSKTGAATQPATLSAFNASNGTLK
jgi:hypothetical protein